MATIQLKGLALTCTPEAQFNTLIEYKIYSDSSYTTFGTAATQVTGQFVSQQNITGLLDDTCYDIRVTATLPGVCGPFIEQFCTGAGTTTTTTSTSTTSTTSTTTTSTTTTSTTTTTTSTTTTSTTTASFCMTEGFPAGDVFAALYWAGSSTDTTFSVMCNSFEVPLPSESRAVWIAFYSDSALTTPIITSLNNYPVTVNAGTVFIGDGTPQYAYPLGTYPYSSTDIDGDCQTSGHQEDMPTVLPSTCFSFPEGNNLVPVFAQITMNRGSGDPTTYGFESSFFNSIAEGGDTGGSPLATLVAAGFAGPQSQLNQPVYGDITIIMDGPALLVSATITIVGTANDGSSGETIGHNFVFGGVTTTKKYFVDANHPVTVTVDQTSP